MRCSAINQTGKGGTKRKEEEKVVQKDKRGDTHNMQLLPIICSRVPLNCPESALFPAPLILISIVIIRFRFFSICWGWGVGWCESPSSSSPTAGVSGFSFSLSQLDMCVVRPAFAFSRTRWISFRFMWNLNYFSAFLAPRLVFSLAIRVLGRNSSKHSRFPLLLNLPNPNFRLTTRRRLKWKFRIEHELNENIFLDIISG